MNEKDTDTRSDSAKAASKAARAILDSPHPKRLPDWEPFDDIRLTIVPRYKMGELSGDEWRQSVNIQFFFKGQEVFSRSARDMQTAILLLGQLWLQEQEPIYEKVISIEEGLCFQPSCRSAAVERCYLKREYSARGELLDAKKCPFTWYREFCDKHSERGDCGLEDADRNYNTEKPKEKP